MAYAINRRVGPAVVRNRVRRRLRAVLDDRRRRGRLAGGAYLVIVRPEAAERTQAQLEQIVEQVMQRIEGKRTTGEEAGA